jgi:hypothetical protein
MERSQKITFAEMRASGVRDHLIYCFGYRCSQGTAISGAMAGLPFLKQRTSYQPNRGPDKSS